MAENNANNDIAGDQPFGGEERQRIETDEILKLVREIRRLADLDLKFERRFYDDFKTEEVLVEKPFSAGLNKVLETLDCVLVWLEESAKKATDEVDGQVRSYAYQQKDFVLWMLCHITALGSNILLAGLLAISSKFLDLSENPYKAEREHLKLCLREVEKQKEELDKLVEKACNILLEIIRETQPLDKKALEFEAIIHQATAQIRSCKSYLSSAKETTDELMKNISTIKVSSRFLRLAGFGITCYGIYHMAPSSSTVDELADFVSPTTLSLLRKVTSGPGKHLAFVALGALSAYAWLSLYPSRAYAFKNDLTTLKLEHIRLAKDVHRLEQKLKHAIDDLKQFKDKHVAGKVNTT